MRVFVAAMVASFGVALFAAAALVWDRRREVAPRLPGRRHPDGSPASSLARWTSPPLVVGYSLLLGVILVFGSCLGLFLV